jgi:hypothetical protein
MSSTPHLPLPLSRVIAADARLSGWDARRRHEGALTRVLGNVLPRPLASQVWVSAASGDILELATPTGAVAAVVRQRAPQLVAALAREGWEFTGLRVRVQPRGAPVGHQKPVPHQWDNNAKRALTPLAAGLPPGPLKLALQRLLRGR